jgi:type II secretory pathway pseudopilin PulG
MQFPSTTRRSAALIAATFSLVLLGACSGPAAEEQDQALDQAQQAAAAAATAEAATPPPVGSCDASQVQGLVGQTWSEAMQAQAKDDAGASEVRVLKPNQPVTMEFIGERLNIEIDEKGLVSGVRCG